MAIQDTAARYAPYVLSIVRIVTALLFLEHGTSRLFGWPSPLPTPALLSMYWFAGVIELVGGALLVLGLFTRPSALIMSGEMAFAYFISHAPAGKGDIEKDEAKKNGAVATIEDGEEAGGRVADEIGKCHFARHDKCRYAREEADDQQSAADKLDCAGKPGQREQRGRRDRLRKAEHF